MEIKDDKAGRKKNLILIVEDNLTFSEALSQILEEKKNLTALSASDFNSGWIKYKKENPNLAILDIRIPGKSGLELCSEIKKDNPSMKVIMLTSYDLPSYREQSFRCGADRFLVKGGDTFEELSKNIDELLSADPSDVEIARLNMVISDLEMENKRLTNIIEVAKAEKVTRADINDLDKIKTFCAAISHNIKNEILNIAGSLKELRLEAGDSQEILEECDIIARSIQYTQILLRRLLDYFILPKPHLESMKALEILEKFELLIKPRLPKNIKLVIENKSNVENIILSTNIEQILGVLLELTTNSIDVLRQTGGKIRICLKQQEGKVTISVIDNGPGLPKQLQREIFTGPVPSEHGLGMGLFLSFSILNVLGGKLELEVSAPEETVFSIVLPLGIDKGE